MKLRYTGNGPAKRGDIPLLPRDTVTVSKAEGEWTLDHQGALWERVEEAKGKAKQETPGEDAK